MMAPCFSDRFLLLCFPRCSAVTDRCCSPWWGQVGVFYLNPGRNSLYKNMHELVAQTR